jgi:hypothetical protein
MKDEIESRLQVLVGQPLVVSYRAADMEMFSFGQLIVKPRRRRPPSRLVTRFGLHVQCPWRIVRSGSLIVGYGDLSEPRSDLPEAEADDFDPNELGTTLREELLEAFHRERQQRPRLVTAVAASEVGDLRVMLDDGCVLEVCPDVAAASREHWRFMDFLGGHFVVGGDGAEYLP